MRHPRVCGRIGRIRRRRLVVSAAVLVVIAAVAAWLLVGTGPHGRTATAAATPSAAGTSAAGNPGTTGASSSASATGSSAAVPTAVPTQVLQAPQGQPPALTPVALNQPADYGNGVRAELVGIKDVDAQARAAGEHSGPALLVTVELTNSTAAPMPLDAVSVNLFYGSGGTPAVPVQDRAGPPFHRTLAPGHSARAEYEFTVPRDQRGLVTVTVGVGPTVATAVFAGRVA